MARVRGAFSARWTIVGTVAVAAIALLAVLPVFGAPNPDADRLRLTEDIDAFFYGSDDPTAAGVEVQPIATKKGCLINPTTGALVSLSSLGPGGTKGPGIFDNGIGIKTGGSNGTPCSETAASEKLVITSTAAAWHKLELDVEAKGNAWIIVELNTSGGPQIHQLLTGSSIEDYNTANPGDAQTPAPGFPYEATTTVNAPVAACADPNDSGPDSGPRDNCRWTIDAGAAFTSVTIYTSEGSVSLEGGGDFADNDPTGFANGLYDSLFYRVGPPTANDDSGDTYQTDEDVALYISLASVLDNDSDVLGGPLTAVIEASPSNGTLTGGLNSDGTFTYTPDRNWFGTDSFTYRAVEGGLESEPATVTIIVDPVNDAPVAVDGPLPATEDTDATYPGDKLATDVEGDTLTVVFASADNGTATIIDGEVVYTPADDFCGTDLVTLTFVVSDGDLDTGSSTVTINVACTADDDSYSMDEREEVVEGDVKIATLTVSAPGVLANDTDTPGSITAGSATTPTNGGSVTLYADGSFAYKPGLYTWSNEETSYQDTWEYTPDYGSDDPQPATVTITVNRNLCQEDTVTDLDGNVFGSFTLLSASGCKNWVPVVANGDEETVVFQPDTPDTTGVYDGTLRIENLDVVDGSLATVILNWSPTPEIAGSYVEIPSCWDLDPSPGINPVLPGNPAEPSGWCFYDVDPVLTGAQIWTVTWKVRGWDDPGFRFR